MTALPSHRIRIIRTAFDDLNLWMPLGLRFVWPLLLMRRL